MNTDNNRGKKRQELSDSQLRTLLAAANRIADRFGQIGSLQSCDIAQLAMIRLISRDRSQPPPLGWLFKTVRSAAFDAGRAQTREAKYLVCLADDRYKEIVCERADENGYLRVNGVCVHEDDTQEIDVYSQVRKVFGQLSAPHKQILILVAEGATYEQIAECLKISGGTVRSRLYYARKRAKELFYA